VLARPRALQAPRRDALERAATGRHAESRTSRRAGKYARHRLGASPDVAVDATLRAAAARGAGEARGFGGSETRGFGARERRGLEVLPEDLRRKLRQHHSPLAVVFVVDNSYSLAAEAMIDQVKGLAYALLHDAANHGDRLAVVAFGGFAEATVALPFTRSARRARERLEQLPVSGRTPLADALVRAHRLLRQERAKHPNTVPYIVAITDGRGTVPLRSGGDATQDTLDQARRIARDRIGVLVADAAAPGSPEALAGRAQELATAARGDCVPFDQLVA
jgi:magnesium chelatase subunit D